MLVAVLLILPSASTLGSPARAASASGSWLEESGIGWLPDFLRRHTGLDLDWQAILDGLRFGPDDDDGSPGTEPPPTPTPSASEVPAPPSGSAVPTASSAPSTSATPTASATPPATSTPSASATPTVTPTAQPLPTLTVAPPAPPAPPAPTPSMTAEPTPTPAPSMTSEPQPGPVPTTQTPSPSQTSAPSTPTVVPSATPTTTPPAPLPTLTITPTPTPTPTPPDPQPSGGPLLIKHGWDIPTPQWLASHQAAADAMPFDGVVVQMRGLSSTVLTSTPTSQADYARALEPMKPVRFDQLKHNFVMVYAGDDGGALADWSVQASNLANLAAAARDAGFAGLAYDGERYFGGSYNWPSACSATLPECVAAARANGERVMSAAVAAWPSMTMLSFYGPWVSHPETCRHTGGAMCNDVSWANELFGPFLAGMADAVAGTSAAMVDGGEVYTLRTQAQFAAFHAWAKALAPTASVGFGIYDQPWLGAPMDASVWESTLRNALATTDRYVWAYNERYDWWGGGGTPVPAEWIDATRQSRSPAG